MSVKRALVCAPLMPEYDRESGSRRVFHLIEFLREAGWAVSFAAENADGGERYMQILQQRGVAVYPGFGPRTEQLVAAGRFDLAICIFWQIAEHWLPKIRALSPRTRVVVDSVDLHFLRNARRLLQPTADGAAPSLLDPAYASEMMREINTYAAADAVLTVSQKEADLVNDLANVPALAYALPDNEDFAPSAIPFAQRKGILFVGNFRHPPNVEAARYLCQDILPRLDPAILAEHPAYVVGNALSEAIGGFAGQLPHVRMVGWVPSLLPYLEHARISVIPLRYGAGTNRKLIQALMVGTPSVSTSVGTEGLNLQDGEHVLVADDPAAFADAVVRLLEDEELWQHLARQGREHIASVHGREAVRARLMHILSEVLDKEPKPLMRGRAAAILQQDEQIAQTSVASYASQPTGYGGYPSVALEILSKVYSTENKLMPPGTLRRDVYNMFWRSLKALLFEGWSRCLFTWKSGWASLRTPHAKTCAQGHLQARAAGRAKEQE
jgi:glycosyltransferase involved in cell wall biosynthesis